MGMNFIRTVKRLGGGMLERRLDEGLAQLLSSVRETSGAGRLTLHLDVEMDATDDGALMVDVQPEIVLRAPRAQVRGMSMYVRDDFSLDTRHPDQPEVVEPQQISLAARGAASSAAAAGA
jgi:hypothetical protein